MGRKKESAKRLTNLVPWSFGPEILWLSGPADHWTMEQSEGGKPESLPAPLP
jgi:hypothetical protein